GQPGGAAGPARGAAPAVPVPLPARGRAADLRGRPPRQEGAQEAGPRRAPDRARGRGPRRPRGRGGARLLRGGAQRDHRRRPAALGRLGSQARGPARGGRRQPRPGGGKRGMTRLLRRLRRLVADALDRTRDLWPDIRRAYGWVHGAARILNNAAGLDAAAVARRLAGLVAAMARHRAKAGALAGAVDHFLKVTRSYRPGLFHCYAVADLPRTNNGLEQLFGSYRRHERRATGRKANGSAAVLRGPVRLLAGLATRLRRRDAGDLAGADRARWRAVPGSLERPRHGLALVWDNAPWHVSREVRTWIKGHTTGGSRPPAPGAVSSSAGCQARVRGSTRSSPAGRTASGPWPSRRASSPARSFGSGCAIIT